MAIPRVTLRATGGRSLKDFPEWEAANEKLADLQSQLELSQHENRRMLQSRNGRAEHEQRRIDAEAEAMVSGAAVAVAEPLPTLQELEHAIAVAQAAVAKQSRTCEEIARRIERECTDEIERPADVADIRRLIGLLDEITTLVTGMQTRRGGIRQRFAGQCSLPELALDANFRNSLPHAKSRLLDGARYFGIEGA